MVWYFIGVYIIKEHYMVTWRYDISLLLLKKIFHSLAALTREIFFNTRREICISVRPCNILYIQWMVQWFFNTFMLDSDLSGGWCLPTFGLETDRTVIFRLYQQILMLQPKLSENQKLAWLRYVTNVCFNTGTLLLLNVVSVRFTSVICTCKLRLVVYL